MSRKEETAYEARDRQEQCSYKEKLTATRRQKGKEDPLLGPPEGVWLPCCHFDFAHLFFRTIRINCCLKPHDFENLLEQSSLLSARLSSLPFLPLVLPGKGNFCYNGDGILSVPLTFNFPV